MPTRPNILLIQSDQHRYDFLGRARHPLIKTPNLDRLASQGMWFNRAYTPSPICCPARQSLLSGLWPENHGGYWNFDGFLTPPLFNSHTWTEDLKAAGYRMGIAGKWHIHPQRGPEEFGFDDAISSKAYHPWREERHLPAIKSDVLPFFGGCDPAKPDDTRTHWLAWHAVALIRRYAADSEQDRPWHIHLGFEEPHLPCCPTREFLDLYRPEAIAPYRNFPDPFTNKPYIQRQQLRSWGLENLTWDDWRRYIWRYLAMVSQVDDALGLVLRALDESGQRDNTLVVYTTDHGDMGGGHGMIDKHYVMYEEVTHDPLIVRWPAVVKPGSECDAFVLHALDLASTIPEAAGLAIPAEFQGRSLMPILRHSGTAPDDWRRAAFSTYNGQQFGLYTQRMIRTDKWKYVWNLTDVDELYALEQDSWELHNRVSDPTCSSTLADLRHQLLAELQAHGDPVVTRSTWARNQLAMNKKL
ncbi:MAG: sulfatase-like hydrolase/transferase [Candidatus Sumerlaeota bacterium]|nr:sulfatase-like hydrolase/transferase [Candidatus Sumerlaeota bacterium]